MRTARWDWQPRPDCVACAGGGWTDSFDECQECVAAAKRFECMYCEADIRPSAHGWLDAVGAECPKHAEGWHVPICEDCAGRGGTFDADCPTCGGTGMDPLVVVGCWYCAQPVTRDDPADAWRRYADGSADAYRCGRSPNGGHGVAEVAS